MAREINLVPDIKNEMIRTLKLRNLVFFICIIVAGASIATSLVFMTTAAVQQAAADGKRDLVSQLSSKLNSYSDLGDFLTIKDQLGNLAEISNNKNMLSRTFGILSALLPQGADKITLSELTVDFSGENPTITFDGQADAGVQPFIDFRVLDSFKKSMDMMRYDYGNYVDRYGSPIPAYCIVESGIDGATFSDRQRGFYAFWLINGEGCNPNPPEEEELEPEYDENGIAIEPEVKAGPELTEIDGYKLEKYDGQSVVRIWRTPQFAEWYGDELEDEGEDEDENGAGNYIPSTPSKKYMDLSGNIFDIPHFESACITYTGKVDNNGAVDWQSSNDTCALIVGGTENGIRIGGSSNGRDSSGELVLKFSATIQIDPEAYNFSNKHMIALAPEGRHNVTDSYVQIQNMFEKEATKCSVNDTACNSNKNNLGEE